MTGIKGRSGIRKDSSIAINRALVNVRNSLPGLFKELKKLAKGKRLRCPKCKYTLDYVPNLDAIKLLIEHGIGKPLQRTEIDISGRLELSGEQLSHWLDRLHEHIESSNDKSRLAVIEAEFYEIPNPLALEQGKSQKESHVQNEATHDATNNVSRRATKFVEPNVNRVPSRAHKYDDDDIVSTPSYEDQEKLQKLRNDIESYG